MEEDKMLRVREAKENNREKAVELNWQKADTNCDSRSRCE